MLFINKSPIIAKIRLVSFLKLERQKNSELFTIKAQVQFNIDYNLNPIYRLIGMKNPLADEV
jgi:hypothetical protein